MTLVMDVLKVEVDAVRRRGEASLSLVVSNFRFFASEVFFGVVALVFFVVVDEAAAAATAVAFFLGM